MNKPDRNSRIQRRWMWRVRRMWHAKVNAVF